MNKLAVSNLAWAPQDEAEALSILREEGFQGVELAPTVLFPNWDGFSVEAGKRLREHFAARGLEVCALQSILFAKPHLQLFDKESHLEFLNHLKQVAAFAQTLGARVLVFGSPKNRKRGQRLPAQAVKDTVPFLLQAGDICSAYDCIVGWEANPAEYACDFVTNVAEAMDLVQTVNHPAVRVHGDAGGMHLCGSPPPTHLFEAAHFCHYHVSEPMLDSLGQHGVDHRSYFAALSAANYHGWLSIEMKRPADGLQGLRRALQFLKESLNA